MNPTYLILAIVSLFSFTQADQEPYEGTAKKYRVIPPISREESRMKQLTVIRTVEINRSLRLVTSYKNGKECSHYVTVVTYCDHYYNGTIRIWTRTF
jgi:hypothetical protein